MENVKEKFVEHLCELDENPCELDNVIHDKSVPNMTQEQLVEQAIIQSDPNVVLRNLAYWLDIAIAKGRHVDFVEQQVMLEKYIKDNGLSSSDNNSESEV